MKTLFRFLFILTIFIPGIASAATDLSGNAFVSITSDTAAIAKNMAFAEARAQIIEEVLSKHADAKQIKELMKNTGDSKLTHMISSTGIDGERLSATTYSANIKMTIDSIAAKQWLDENGVYNWLGQDDVTQRDKLTVVINISGGLRDWIELHSALRSENIDLGVKRIFGGAITANIPAVSRTAFVSAVRMAGWRYSDADGFLRIWR